MSRRALAAGLIGASALLSAGLAAGPAAAYWTASPATTASAAAATLNPPATGSILAVTSTSATVRIATGPAAGPSPTSYQALRGGSTVCTVGATLPVTCPADTGLLPGNSYTYQVISLSGSTWLSHATLTLTAVTTAPTAPAKPDLLAASDTGSSATDDVTSDVTPTLTGAAGSASAGSTLTLYDNGGGTALAATTVAANGSWSATLSALGEGTHSLTAKVGYGTGTPSAPSPALVLTVDSVAAVSLTCPPPSSGHRNTFAGSQSDNGRPITVTVDPPGVGTTITLTVGNPTGGVYSVQSSNNQLTAGRVYNASASQTDLAGNIGTSAVCNFTAS